MAIRESGEMYLETILRLKQSKQTVRAVDVVESLSYAKSSVSRGINLLKKRGLIIIDLDGAISFTPEGLERANRVFTRHGILTEFFTSIGVSTENAENDACRIEHVISDETVEAIKRKLNESK